MSPKIWVQNNFEYKQFWIQKFEAKKYLGLQKCLGPKEVWSKTFGLERKGPKNEW